MKTFFISVIMSILIGGTSIAGQDGLVQVRSGFLTGNTFRELSDDGKAGYAMGFVNGLLMAPAFKAPRTEMRWVEECISGMADTQIAAILDKFLAENPARWHEPMNVLSHVALKASCKKLSGR